MDVDPTVSRHEIGMPTQLSHDLSALNVKVLLGAFNQEKTLVGAFSVIVKTDCGTDDEWSTTQHIS